MPYLQVSHIMCVETEASKINMNYSPNIFLTSKHRVLHMESTGPTMICGCGASLNLFNESMGTVMRVQDFKILLANAYDR
jgi:hypothetical protein